MGLRASQGEPCCHVVAQCVDVRARSADWDREADRDDSLPCWGKRAGQRQGPRQLREGTGYPTEYRGGFGDNARQLEVILDRQSLCGTDIPYGIHAELVGGVGFSVENERHRELLPKYSGCDSKSQISSSRVAPSAGQPKQKHQPLGGH